MRQNETLTRRQYRGIEAILTNATIVKAAKKSKIGRATLNRWIAEKTFRGELARQQSNRLREVSRLIFSEQTKSIEKLACLRDSSDSDLVSLHAAKSLLEYAGKYLEKIDYEDRFEKLEGSSGEEHCKPD